MNAAVHEPPAVPMPAGVRDIYTYEVFNAASWIVVLGSPMLLYFQRLHASATVLALAASLAPLLSTLQIPAAAYVEKIGHRRLVVNGWTLRSLFIVGMTVVAFLPGWMDPTTRIVLMLFLMLGYNVSRGISLCGIMPWFMLLVPESRRGEFLAKDQIASSLSVAVALTVFSSILGAGKPAWYAFGVVYLLGALSAFISVRFLRRVPDVPVEQATPNRAPLPWKDIFLYPPFQRFIRYNVVVNLALGASGVFWVRFFRESLHISDQNTLRVGAVTTVVMTLALYLASSIIDRTGSRPALALSGGIFVVHFSIWGLVAAGVIPATVEIVIFQSIISGLAGALWNLANLRAVIGIVPVMGRAHFLALYSVFANVTVALIPLLWGPVFDVLGHWRVDWGWWHWNSFAIFYLVLALNMAGALVLLGGVHESGEPMDWDDFTHELLVKTPARAVSRLLVRLRGPGL
jgi:MFS family permease